MRISIPGIFRPRPEPAPEAAPAPAPAQPAPREVGETTERFGVPVTYMRSDIPEVDSAFGYGHLDGRRGVPPENFREFIAHTVEGEAIERLLAELETREREAREKAASLRSQRADLAGRTGELAVLRERSERAEAAAVRADAAVQEAAAASEGHWQSGSKSQAAIFLTAGALFIFGDVVMSQKIVADALSLTGSKIFGLIDESWVFALGLAMISIVLKPAYDRLVEKHYWEGKERKFVITIGVLALLSVVTLWVLGAFRFEANGMQSAVQLAMANPDPAARGRELATIQAQINASALARWSFILSGILFAAAGAASLGIGLRYLRFHLHVRKPAARRLKEHAAERAQAKAMRETAAAELARHAADLERLRATLADEPPATELENRAESLAVERRALLARLSNERRLRLRSLYDDGYELGIAVAADEREATEGERPRRKRPRPFVALRRALREQAIPPATLN
ncbi:hypothetical protein [Longimicrobium sp.]|uniref:hypothetical protein n=1 Tax=Longimicrobium sp. TaxID=2029185 RepID=UPI002B73D2F1|nr:hypothetical protein [Longimicrobium sp.]HSU13047.1 hypothetical protein [Longimicrobium sp.]